MYLNAKGRVFCKVKQIASQRRIFIIGFLLALASTLRALPNVQSPRTSARPSFGYNKSTAFDLKEESAKEEGGVVVRDVNYAAYTSERGRIKAYIVTPAGKGQFAGVLYFHWLGRPNGNRNEFLSEAVALAKRGTVSVLIQGYFPWAVQPVNAETDRQRVIAETIEVRRALDLLLSQPKVDRKRIGYVGHDYGAMYGAILSGVEKRVKTYVFVASIGSWSDWSLAYWPETHKKGAEAYRRGMDAVDPINYVSSTAPAPSLYQFANADEHIPKTTATALFNAASKPKAVVWYDTDHAMNIEAVRNDRRNWLARHLRMAK